MRDRRVKDFGGLEVSELYCPNCQGSVPVRKRIILVLPEGDKYHYTCSFCGNSIGEKIEPHIHRPPLHLRV